MRIVWVLFERKLRRRHSCAGVHRPVARRRFNQLV